MKLGIMQPYFFPYIGYWQLMNAVDTYVIYDDVNFIKNGWINRNRIMINGNASYFNLPIVGASSFVLINEVKLSNEVKLRQKLLKTLHNAYTKAPYFKEVIPVLDKILTGDQTLMIDVLELQIREIAKYLRINTNIIVSSREVKKDSSLHGQDKVLDICRNLGASEYYNAIGGQELYSHEAFAQNGIKLHFLKTNPIVYEQFKNEFLPNLSIIDVMMFNSREKIAQMLNDFQLV